MRLRSWRRAWGWSEWRNQCARERSEPGVARRSCSAFACRPRLVHGEGAITIPIAAPTFTLTERVELRHEIARRVRSVWANPLAIAGSIGAQKDPASSFGNSGRPSESETFSRLTYSYIGISLPMPRAATTSDTFNAIAEPRRRDILDYLAPRERPVGDIVIALGLAQPSVSKHLRVLRDVGLVEVRRDGRQVFYRTNAEGIRPLHEWTSRFERYWRNQLTRVKERAERN